MRCNWLKFIPEMSDTYPEFSRKLAFTRSMILALFLTISACCKEDDIPKLKRDLYSSLPKERNEAALELARCGSSAETAVERLGDLIYDENVGVQSSAAYALRKIDTESARAILKRAEDARRKR